MGKDNDKDIVKISFDTDIGSVFDDRCALLCFIIALIEGKADIIECIQGSESVPYDPRVVEAIELKKFSKP